MVERALVGTPGACRPRDRPLDGLVEEEPQAVAADDGAPVGEGELGSETENSVEHEERSQNNKQSVKIYVGLGHRMHWLLAILASM